MPRSMDVIMRHESVERAKAGDKCALFPACSLRVLREYPVSIP
jgi:hypothetical protein